MRSFGINFISASHYENVKLCRKTEETVVFNSGTRRAHDLKVQHFGDAMDSEDEHTVLLMHDLLENKKHMESIGRTLSAMTRQAVITLDLRNHGDSPHTSSHKYKEMAMDVQELMNKQGINKAILLGHSMGGRTAMSLALMNPKIVAGLIIVDISPVSSCKDLLFEYPKVLEVMQNIDFVALKAKKVSAARQYAKKLLRKKIRDRFTLRAVLSNINVRRDGVIGWTCNLDAFIKNFKYIAVFPKDLLDKTYYGPALFIGGQHSEFIPPDDLPRIREIFPRSVISYVPETSHYVHQEDQKKFMELVIAFIRNNT